MHKININLHNLKTALIFSIEISRDYSSRYDLRSAKLHNFSPLRGRDPRGGGTLPPAVRWEKTQLGYVRHSWTVEAALWKKKAYKLFNVSGAAITQIKYTL